MAATKTVPIGQRIRQAREAKGLTQAQVVEGVYTHAYLCLVETGKRDPTPKMLAVIAPRLGLSLEEITPPTWTCECGCPKEAREKVCFACRLEASAAEWRKQVASS